MLILYKPFKIGMDREIFQTSEKTCQSIEYSLPVKIKNYDKLDQVDPFSFFHFKKMNKQKPLSLILDLKVVGEYFF